MNVGDRLFPGAPGIERMGKENAFRPRLSAAAAGIW
jgi:hypothetical protein